MPLRSGRSRATISANISELMHGYAEKGSIGTSHPANAEAAQRQAIAIALDKARRGRKRNKTPRHRALEAKYGKKNDKGGA